MNYTSDCLVVVEHIEVSGIFLSQQYHHNPIEGNDVIGDIAV
jgi:hypothetical protein